VPIKGRPELLQAIEQRHAELVLGDPAAIEDRHPRQHPDTERCQRHDDHHRADPDRALLFPG
jgi:hypothetical protein